MQKLVRDTIEMFFLGVEGITLVIGTHTLLLFDFSINVKRLVSLKVELVIIKVIFPKNMFS